MFRYRKANPEKARRKATRATAVLESDLKARITGPNGEMIISDMPPRVGGGGSAPTAGWFMEAALATSYATGIEMRAAQESIELSTLEVSIDTEFDVRGMFGFDESIKSGPLNMRPSVRIGAKGVAEKKLLELMKWIDKYSWVGNAICRSVPIKTEVEIV